jgi:hypothetical protein
VGKIFTLKFAPEPVEKPSIYERVCRMFWCEILKNTKR